MQRWFVSYLINRKQYILNQKLPFLYVKHYIRCSEGIGVGPNTFFFVVQSCTNEAQIQLLHFLETIVLGFCLLNTE